MGVVTTADAPDDLCARLRNADVLTVVCLCAAWCDSCQQFRVSYDDIATADAAGVYVWLDIEDDEALVGDIDIETFPTLAVYHGEQLLHFGISLPQAANVARLIAAAAERTEPFQGAPGGPGACRTRCARASPKRRPAYFGPEIGKYDGTSLGGCDQTSNGPDRAASGWNDRVVCHAFDTRR